MNESAENYLETILILLKKSGEVRSIDVVNETGFSKPSISEAMRKLKSQKLIKIDSDGYISFTALGKETAEKILERHRILTNALIYLGVPKDIAEQDACKVEHSLSEISFQRIKEHTKKKWKSLD